MEPLLAVATGARSPVPGAELLQGMALLVGLYGGQQAAEVELHFQV